jgi:8-oxo-dGTP pyrophosphatase MutT (NUDIX family)
MKTRIIIVDEHDNPIGLKERGILAYEDIYRVSALWLTDTTTGDILLAQRKWTKHNDPGKWALAVAGTVDEGESYEENIKKETEEEIGLTGVTFTLGPKEYVDDGKHKFFCQWFYAQIDKDTALLTIQKDEVEAIQWIPSGDLRADVVSNPDKYVPSAKTSLDLLQAKAT